RDAKGRDYLHPLRPLRLSLPHARRRHEAVRPLSRMRDRAHAEPEGPLHHGWLFIPSRCPTERAMSSLEFGIMFSLGLVSSLHCVQMCGPLVLTYSVALKQSASLVAPPAALRSRLLASHLAYNGGRILTYSALGAIAGIAGGTVGFVGHLAGLSGVAATVAGGLMILAGLVMLNI